MKAIIVLVCMFAVVFGQDAASYPPKGTFSSPHYPRPLYPKQSEENPPMPYRFEYAVKDEPSNNDYSHQEQSDGKVVTGAYRVVLPDGRTQIVTYKADENGYVADVKYEGEAKYPEYKPSYKPAAYPQSE